MGPRYIGPFRFLARVDKVAYRLQPNSTRTFHVSQLRKCLVNDSTVVPLEDIQVDDSLNYIEQPVVILDRKSKDLRNKRVELVKVQWQHRKGLEWTWEPVEEMGEHYLELF